MKEAGWDMDRPMSIENSLFALTGKPVTTPFSASKSSSITKESFTEVIMKPIEGDIAVLVTKKEHSVERVKPNYPYVLWVAEGTCGKRYTDLFPGVSDCLLTF